MMRIALISDIHSNRIALRAVLAEIRRIGVDQIVCLGDVANLGCPCIMGNHDEFLLDPTLVRTYSQSLPVVTSVDWSRSRLSAVELESIRSFQRQYETPLGRDLRPRLAAPERGECSG
jgi:3',5'-cyclic AMP phosphodiesterase CpdA